MITYKIVRYFQNAGKRTINTGLTLEEAQEWCNNPETGSRTATSSAAKARTRRSGQWFDGFTEER